MAGNQNSGGDNFYEREVRVALEKGIVKSGLILKYVRKTYSEALHQNVTNALRRLRERGEYPDLLGKEYLCLVAKPKGGSRYQKVKANTPQMAFQQCETKCYAVYERVI